MEKYLAYVDLLGFTTMIEKDLGRSRELLSYYYDVVYAILKDNDTISGNISSDCVLAYADELPVLLNSLSAIYRECHIFNATSPDFYLLPRGAVSRGFMEIGKRDTSIQLTRDFMIGTALVHSSKLEQRIKGSRLLLAIDSKEGVAKVETDSCITSPIYENCAFRFWEHYTYNDVLWPVDSSLGLAAQSEKSVELLEISLNLLRYNSENIKSLEHYTNTVRVCLLSYCLLQPDSFSLLQDILHEFSDDRYWLLWLTVLEVLIQGSGEVKIPSLLISSIRALCLSQGWAIVISELSKPGKEAIRARITSLLNS